MTEPKSNCQVAVYYFPNWHPCSWNARSYGQGNSEWVTVQAARPRFPGHQQPKVPLWGYEDESDPQVMEKKISAAAHHSIDAWIFDWYWWENGPSLESCLEKGFFNASNNQRLKFGIMWANHRPVPRSVFDQATGHIIERYFNHPSIWRVEGKPYFSIYELQTLIAGLGGVDATRQALDSFREKAMKAGAGEIHLNVVEWGHALFLKGKQVLPDSHRSNADLPTELFNRHATAFFQKRNNVLTGRVFIKYRTHARKFNINIIFCK